MPASWGLGGGLDPTDHWWICSLVFPGFSSKVMRHSLDDEELDVSHRRGPVVATPMPGADLLRMLGSAICVEIHSF